MAAPSPIANRPAGSGACPPVPDASQPLAETEALAEQLPLAHITAPPPDTLMVNVLSSAWIHPGSSAAVTSMYCDPTPLPKSQKRAPVGAEHAAVQPPVQEAVAISSQLKFAWTSQLPWQSAIHCAEHIAVGACPVQLTLHWFEQLAEHCPMHVVMSELDEHCPLQLASQFVSQSPEQLKLP
jgi:hypothetical protein